MSNHPSPNNDTKYHVCRICSDRAIGYNFGVLTCEPCKAFFRRTADKLDELQCPFNNDCDIDRYTRKICRKCRLVKCFEVGMKKDWVLNEDEKKSHYSQQLRGSNKHSYHHSSTNNYKPLSSSCADFVDISASSRNLTNNLQQQHLNDLESFSSIRHAGESSFSPMSQVRTSSIDRFSIPSLTSSSSSSSSSSSHSNSASSSSFMGTRKNCGIVPTAPSPSPSSSSSSSPSVPTVDLTTKMPSLCGKQYSNDLQNILRSNYDSNWLIRFLVESHSLNSRLSSTNANVSTLAEDTSKQLNVNLNEIKASSSQGSNRPASPSTKSNSCTNRVGVIVDGRKLVSPLNISVPKAGSSVTYDEPRISSVHSNLKARVIRKILDANFAPSHLKQGSREGVDLNELEIETIESLVNAFNFFNQPLNSTDPELSSAEGVARFTDLYLEKLISGCRSLTSYSRLCLEDQITLVKSGFTDILAVKSHLRSDSRDTCWQVSDQHQPRLEKSLITNWIKDPKVVCIIFTIVLFNPDLPNLQAIDTVKLEQYTYIYLLKRYLESQCGSSCRARTEHFNLIHIIEEIMVMQQQHQMALTTSNNLPVSNA